MDHSDDTNAAIWHSGEAVQAWAAEAQAQERHRAEHRRFMAALLSFGPQIDYLRSAGFEGVDVYWKQLENVIYGGRRPV